MLLFLDGVGLGEPDSSFNPLAAARTPVLDDLLGSRLDATADYISGDDVVFRSLDATLEHDGLPQSATGQTAILTGLNAAALMQGHYGPWPGPTLQRVLRADTLFHHGEAAGGAALANAYPPGYFAAMTGRRYRPNANAFAAGAAGVELRGSEHYLEGTGVPSDLDGAHFAALGRGSLIAGPEGSARAISALAKVNAFTMLDVWLTDHYGHRRDLEAARSLLERIDTFLGELVTGPASLRAAGGTVVVTSDHGNLEDLRSGSHTRNRVPLIAVGRHAQAFAYAASLLDVAPAIRRVIGGSSEA